MTSIASILNPVAKDRGAHLPSPVSSAYGREFSPPPPKKQKMTKDGAVFNKGKIQGELRYPPCEVNNIELARLHREFEVYPMGRIMEFPRHIPYNSEKKAFHEKTGRESFELFQYTFKIPKQDKEYVVMWDYNIGLVRMTPFFKCCNYSKTTPAKMLNQNPGLRDVCHSITGGALAAQGYWMPYQAAKAVAATFCFNIRHALTPVFGIDFLHLCTPPDHPSHGRMVIDPDVVQQCTEEAAEYRRLAGRHFSREHSLLPSPKTPDAIRYAGWRNKSLRPKPLGGHGSESGYGTDSDHDDRYSASRAYRNEWTPANTPRSVAFLPSPPPRSLLTSVSTNMSVAGSSSVAETDTVGEVASSPSYSSNSGSLIPKRRLSPADEEYNEASGDEGINTERPKKSRTRKEGVIQTQDERNATRDAKAAYMLMKLHMADATLIPRGDESVGKGKKRRVSA